MVRGHRRGHRCRRRLARDRARSRLLPHRGGAVGCADRAAAPAAGHRVSAVRADLRPVRAQHHHAHDGARAPVDQRSRRRAHRVHRRPGDELPASAAAAARDAADGRGRHRRHLRPAVRRVLDHVAVARDRAGPRWHPAHRRRGPADDGRRELFPDGDDRAHRGKPRQRASRRAHAGRRHPRGPGAHSLLHARHAVRAYGVRRTAGDRPFHQPLMGSVRVLCVRRRVRRAVCVLPSTHRPRSTGRPARVLRAHRGLRRAAPC